MRKLLIAGMMFITMPLMISSCSKNTTTTMAVPKKVVSEFYDMYPTAEKVNWKYKGDQYHVDFEIQGMDLNATYTQEGDFVRADS